MTSSLINYQQLQSVATNLITSLGASYKLLRPNVNGTDAVLATTPGTFDKQMVSLIAGSAGGLIASDKKVIYLPVIKFGKVEPQAEDRLISVSNPSQGWRIIEVDVVRPDGKTTILYTCTVS